jgi:uncharacterized tellurite resistance protein B-like protein
MNISDLVNLGSAGAVIVTVAFFLAHLRMAQRQDRAERESERASFMELIKNDLKHVGDGLQEVVKALRKGDGP